LKFTPLNNEYEVKYVNPQMFYDINLRVDIPQDAFLIVTPSKEALTKRCIVGNAFFTKDGPTQQQEQVLIVVPQPYRVEQTAQGKTVQSAQK
jgi:hypothetical protein